MRRQDDEKGPRARAPIVQQARPLLADAGRTRDEHRLPWRDALQGRPDIVDRAARSGQLHVAADCGAAPLLRRRRSVRSRGRRDGQCPASNGFREIDRAWRWRRPPFEMPWPEMTGPAASDRALILEQLQAVELGPCSQTSSKASEGAARSGPASARCCRPRSGW